MTRVVRMALAPVEAPTIWMELGMWGIKNNRYDALFDCSIEDTGKS